MLNRCKYDPSIKDADDAASVAPGNYKLSNDLSNQPGFATPGNAFLMSFENGGDRADVQSSLQQCVKSTRCGKEGDVCENLAQTSANVNEVEVPQTVDSRGEFPPCQIGQVDRFMDMGCLPNSQYYVGLGLNSREDARRDFARGLQSVTPIDQSGILPNGGGDLPHWKCAT